MNECHCIAIVDRQLVDPEDKIRRELCPASFDALAIIKIVSGYRFVKKSNSIKRQRHR